MTLGERINVSERIEGREWSEETYPAGLQEACIMRFIFWRNAHVSESMFQIFGRCFWSIQIIKTLYSVRDSFRNFNCSRPVFVMIYTHKHIHDTREEVSTKKLPSLGIQSIFSKTRRK